MKKILIIMEPSEIKEELNRQLSAAFHVISCDNGIEGLDAIREFCPDFIVVDLMLSQMDGVSMLEHAWNGGYRPKVVAFSSYVSDYILRALERISVCDVIRGGWDIAQILNRIMDVAYCDENVQGRRADNILLSLGFKMNTSGYRITSTALNIFIQDPTQKMTGQLYPAVAAACAGTPSQAEKAIRDSIESAWKDRNESVWRMYFPAGKNGKTAKPTNGEFLARIGRCLIENANYPKRNIG